MMFFIKIILKNEDLQGFFFFKTIQKKLMIYRDLSIDCTKNLSIFRDFVRQAFRQVHASITSYRDLIALQGISSKP